MRRTLRAMRRLAPDTRLAERAGDQEQEILEELLVLPDEIDEVTWLAREKGELAARHVLKRVLVSLQQEYVAARNSRSRADLPPGFGPIRDSLLQTWGGAESDHLFPSSEAEWDRPGRLAEMLRRVRRVRPAYFAPGGIVPVGEFGALTADLLRLPDQADPVRWLAANRSEFVSLTLLRQIISAAMPMPGTAAYPKRDYIGERLILDEKIDFLLEEVAHSAQGFAVVGTLQMRDQAEIISQGATHTLRWWEGFDWVEDDSGYAYLCQRFTPTILDGFGATWQIRMEYYPAIPAGAKVLTFSATPAFLVGTAIGDKGAIPVPEVALNNVTWQFVVSHGPR